MKAGFCGGVLMALLAVCWAVAAQAQTATSTPAQTQTAPRADFSRWDYRLQARELGPGVYVVEGDNDDFSVPNGCNIINTGFITTGAGVLVINTGPSKRYGDQLLQLIARTTREPVVQVLHLNHHPDYFLGNQAFADVPRVASAATTEGMKRDAAGYETNLYRLCGDWMLGTESVLPNKVLDTAAGQGVLRVGNRELQWLALGGHTASDLVLTDRSTGIVFAGGLIFHERIPTTPHANVPEWLASLQALERLPARQWVPSHGPVHSGVVGIEGTRRFLQWLDKNFGAWAEQGLEMNEVLRAPVPEEFRRWAAFKTEYVRNVAHLYPLYEKKALPAGR